VVVPAARHQPPTRAVAGGSCAGTPGAGRALGITCRSARRPFIGGGHCGSSRCSRRSPAGAPVAGARPAGSMAPAGLTGQQFGAPDGPAPSTGGPKDRRHTPPARSVAGHLAPAPSHPRAPARSRSSTSSPPCTHTRPRGKRWHPAINPVATDRASPGAGGAHSRRRPGRPDRSRPSTHPTPAARNPIGRPWSALGDHPGTVPARGPAGACQLRPNRPSSASGAGAAPGAGAFWTRRSGGGPSPGLRRRARRSAPPESTTPSRARPRRERTHACCRPAHGGKGSAHPPILHVGHARGGRSPAAVTRRSEPSHPVEDAGMGERGGSRFPPSPGVEWAASHVRTRRAAGTGRSREPQVRFPSPWARPACR
jgi:hypothetical protein